MENLAEAVSHSRAATFQRFAAAVTSICRAAAPTLRIGVHSGGVAMLPPATWRPYTAVSRSASSVRTCAHSTSNSSAMSIGSIVLMPWPISGFFEAIVTMLSGPIRT
jgi:hypothetical protein